MSTKPSHAERVHRPHSCNTAYSWSGSVRCSPRNSNPVSSFWFYILGLWELPQGGAPGRPSLVRAECSRLVALLLHLKVQGLGHKRKRRVNRRSQGGALLVLLALGGVAQVSGGSHTLAGLARRQAAPRVRVGRVAHEVHLLEALQAGGVQQPRGQPRAHHLRGVEAGQKPPLQQQPQRLDVRPVQTIPLLSAAPEEGFPGEVLTG